MLHLMYCIGDSHAGFGTCFKKLEFLNKDNNIMSGRFPPLRFARNQVGAGKPANICQQLTISKTRPAGILWSIDRT